MRVIKENLGMTIVVILAAIGLISFFFDRNTSPKGNEIEVWVCAQQVVMEHLKAPSTAKFCSYPDADINRLGGDEYEVQGSVTAENGFGAMLTQSFTVTLELTGNGFRNETCVIY